MEIKELDNGDFFSLATEFFMSSCPCKHLKTFKAEQGITSYTVLHAFFVACTAEGSVDKKVQEVKCSHCQIKSNRMHACLHCVYFGCFDEHHIHKHAAEKEHNLAIDILYGNVFCFKCGDYTYDEEFCSISKKQKQLSGKIKGSDVYLPWEPSKEEIKLLREHDFIKVKDDSCIGLRGLVNLGNTCYMNCIIQVLVHTPLLRDYFLSEAYICHCQDDPKTRCLACVLFDIFQEFYSGIISPFIPTVLLFVVWRDSPHLAGAEQHDALLFYLAMFEALHQPCQNKGTDEKFIRNDSRCSCIIHQIFSGISQSDFLCLKCNKLSPIVEPFRNISLSLDAAEKIEVKEGLEDASLKKIEVQKGSVTLTECLDRYIRTHSVVSKCEACEGMNRTRKDTMKILPVVICFHFQRKGLGGKNETHVSFPEYLDLSRYTTEYQEGITPKNVFTLFAVVNHISTDNKEDGGHYITYIRQHRDWWYKCDDHTISKASNTEVHGSEGYLLFYQKQVLEYGKTDTESPPSVT